MSKGEQNKISEKIIVTSETYESTEQPAHWASKAAIPKAAFFKELASFMATLG